MGEAQECGIETRVVLVVAIVPDRTVGWEAVASRDWQFWACGF